MSFPCLEPFNHVTLSKKFGLMCMAHGVLQVLAAAYLFSFLSLCHPVYQSHQPLTVSQIYPLGSFLTLYCGSCIQLIFAHLCCL